MLDPGRLSGLANGSSSANSLNQAALSSFLGTAGDLVAACFGDFGGLLLLLFDGVNGPSMRLGAVKS